MDTERQLSLLSQNISSHNRPRLAQPERSEAMIVVPYAMGAATPTEIAQASEPFGGALFVLDEADPYLVEMRPVLESLGPTVPQAGGLAAVCAALAGRRADGVLTFTDKLIGPAAELAEQLGLPFHSRETARYCSDKLLQRERLNAAGVSDVAITEIAIGPDAPDPDPALFPAIIKPRHGAGSEHTVIVGDPARFRERTAQLDPGRRYVAEAYLRDGPPAGVGLANYFSVESLVNGPAVAHFGVCGRLPLAEPAREAGSVFPVLLPPAQLTAVTQLAERAIAALGIAIGFVHTEIKLTPDGPCVIEVNGRLGGDIQRLAGMVGMSAPVPVAVSLAAGVSLPLSRQATGVALRHMYHLPVAAKRVRTLPAMRELAGMPGMVRARQLRRPGSSVDWRLGTPGMVLELWLHAPDETTLREYFQAVCEVLAATVTWD
jgi:ATP-grasp domain-containing protein